MIFGRVTTKPGGSQPPVASTSVATKTSRVRRLRAASSFESVLMRMPMNGGSVPARAPSATARAADTACPSSSASGRLP